MKIKKHKEDIEEFNIIYYKKNRRIFKIYSPILFIIYFLIIKDDMF